MDLLPAPRLSRQPPQSGTQPDSWDQSDFKVVTNLLHQRRLLPALGCFHPRRVEMTFTVNGQKRFIFKSQVSERRAVRMLSVTDPCAAPLP